MLTQITFRCAQRTERNIPGCSRLGQTLFRHSSCIPFECIGYYGVYSFNQRSHRRTRSISGRYSPTCRRTTARRTTPAYGWQSGRMCRSGSTAPSPAGGRPSKEYLRGTKERIEAVHSVGDALAVFTRSSIFLITGNSEQSWGVTKIDDEYGTVKRDTIQVANGHDLVRGNQRRRSRQGAHARLAGRLRERAHHHGRPIAPVACLLYARSKERKALHFCVHAPATDDDPATTRTFIVSIPSSTQEDTLRARPCTAAWYCIKLGILDEALLGQRWEALRRRRCWNGLQSRQHRA